jgi:hypothetical protein
VFKRLDAAVGVLIEFGFGEIKRLGGAARAGIDGDLLDECLQVAETIIVEDTFKRWSAAPVRGFGAGNLRMEPFVVVLTNAANDESLLIKE